MLPEVPFFDGFWYIVFALVAAVCWRIWGHHVVHAFQAQQQRQRDAELQAYADRMNPKAHFRQSVDQISERTPPIEPKPDGTATWNGQSFATREDAETARWRHVMTEARAFYQELDRTMGHKIRGPST